MIGRSALYIGGFPPSPTSGVVPVLDDASMARISCRLTCAIPSSSIEEVCQMSLAYIAKNSDQGADFRVGDPNLARSVSEIVARLKVPADDIQKALESLEESFGQDVYSELLYVLAHLRMEPDEARKHWDHVLKVRRDLQELLGGVVDVRVALVHYFVNVNRTLKNPKIIELRLFQETQASVYRDELTGLFNYRYFREHLPREIERNDRHDNSLSLVMIDIDDFKRYNDTHGHLAGNRALVALAELIEEAIRASDVALRYGGEEFVVMLPYTPKKDSLIVAERIRQRIERHRFATENLTVSLGIAAYPGDSVDPDDLVQKADSAMYMAKSRGKNCVCLYGDDRRTFKRIDAKLKGTLCGVSAECCPFTTLDVSKGGVLLLADRNLKVGSLIDISMNIDEEVEELACTGRVVRVEESGEDEFQAALQIVDISQRDRHRFYEYLHTAPGRS
ncbi:diguanylate cyclase [Candidatus Fermentibacteria bacterium]|nr:diguanylate cyclase [Candidatus Fermentibacteria bacterium]